MSQTLQDKLASIVNNVTASLLFPACVAGVIFKNGERIIIPSGRYTPDHNSPLVFKDSIFDIASITKVLPTASLIIQALDEKLLNLDSKIASFLPALQNNYTDTITIFHALTYSLNFSFRLSDYKDQTPEEILKVIFTAPLSCPPGKNSYFANANGILLGLVAEKIFNKPLHLLLTEHFTKPLLMTRTCFRPLEQFSKKNIVPSQNEMTWRHQIVQGEVHDPTAYTLSKIMDSGAAGVFSTVPDLLTFIEVLLNKGEFHGKHYFSKASIVKMQTNQSPDPKASVSLGWQLNPKHLSKHFSPTTLYKTGHTGCIIIADIEKGIGFVFLSNYLFENPTQENKIDRKKLSDHYQPLNQFRSLFIEQVFKSL